MMKTSYSKTFIIKDNNGYHNNKFNSATIEDDDRWRNLTDNQLQKYLLDGVSRTFALTIAQLPEDLKQVVTNAYLLCRIIDTIEDEPYLSCSEKRKYCELFVNVVQGKSVPEVFTNAVYPRLSDQTSDKEKELIGLTPKVIHITNSFSEPQRKALAECVCTMSNGMIHFQENSSVSGLEDLNEMEKYCYFVAGVVGEMLTRLFCMYSPEIAKHEEVMMNLAVSFGKGLQMTNILKDLWKDYDQSVCWLPKSVFMKHGFNLEDLKHKTSTSEFQQGITYLIGVTHTHLENAVSYSLLIPEDETGIRKFCLWAIGMAVLTLRKINKNIDYTDSDHVKITRNSVKATIFSTNLFIKNNFMIKLLFELSRKGLPYHKNKQLYSAD